MALYERNLTYTVRKSSRENRNVEKSLHTRHDLIGILIVDVCDDAFVSCEDHTYSKSNTHPGSMIMNRPVGLNGTFVHCGLCIGARACSCTLLGCTISRPPDTVFETE